MSRLKLWLKAFVTLLVFSLVFLGVWGAKDFNKLKNSTSQGWFQAPTKFYSAPLKIIKNQNLSSAKLANLLLKSGLNERGPSQSLGENDFTYLPSSLCERKIGTLISSETRTCFIIFKNHEKILIELSHKEILNIFKIENGTALPLEKFYLEPLLFSQLSQGKYVLRSFVKISQVPRYCLDGILAIEDDRFLRHGGISPRGILRAALINLKHGRLSQGGSTLTQQLVKNKFLTNEKTFTRKFKEAWLSLLLEVVLTKEQILESYLNYIYWGQSGPYSIHGIEEAAKYYFEKEAKDLNLAECSLLAGAIKGPGLYGPHKERSLERQQEVLDRMLELNLISSEEQKHALENPPEVKAKNEKRAQASYYIQAALEEAKKLGLEDPEGLSFYTELDLFAQEVIDKNMDAYLRGRSEGYQGTFILGDNKLNSVIALSNGLSSSLNFNSAIYAQRQIGSLAKPFVYLTALEANPIKYNPLFEISNEPFTYRYDGQSWTPKNYSAKNQKPFYYLYQALSQSKNIPTIRLMSEFGYKKVYKNLIKHGFESFSPVTPSLALGAFESSPLQVLQAYINLGRTKPFKKAPSFLRKVQDKENNILYIREIDFKEDFLSPEKRILIEMMKQTLVSGTARSSKSLNLKGFYAGKTGTTNEHKDGWFAALSPDYTAISWVSEAPFLTDRGIKITGATAALPLWKNLAPKLELIGRYSAQDWPVDFDKVEYFNLRAEDGEVVPLLFLR